MKKELYFSWGIFQITVSHNYITLIFQTIVIVIYNFFILLFSPIQRALSFLNNDGSLRHNNVNLYSVFVNEESGEWKLGCVEYMSTVDALYTPLPHTLQTYSPPDARENVKPGSKW